MTVVRSERSKLIDKLGLANQSLSNAYAQLQDKETDIWVILNNLNYAMGEIRDARERLIALSRDSLNQALGG